VYGKCIAADHNGVYKDKCLTEFVKLKDCYTVRDLRIMEKGGMADNAGRRLRNGNDAWFQKLLRSSRAISLPLTP